MPYRNGQQGMDSGLQLINVKLYISLNVVMNTTQSTHWMLSLRQFLRRHQPSRQKLMNTNRRDTASLKGSANAWSQEKRLRPNSQSITMLKDHMMKSTLTDLRLTIEWGAAAVINRHFQNDETTCRQLSKRLPNNNTIFAAEATAITLALNYYRHMDPAGDGRRRY